MPSLGYVTALPPSTWGRTFGGASGTNTISETSLRSASHFTALGKDLDVGFRVSLVTVLHTGRHGPNGAPGFTWISLSRDPIRRYRALELTKT